MLLLYFYLITLLVGFASSIQLDFTRTNLWISPKNDFIKSSDANKTGSVDGSSDVNLEWKTYLENEDTLMGTFSLDYLGKGKNTNVTINVCEEYGYMLLEHLGVEFFNKIFAPESRVQQCPISKDAHLTLPGILQWSRATIPGLTCDVDAIATVKLIKKLKLVPIAKATYKGKITGCDSSF